MRHDSYNQLKNLEHVLSIIQITDLGTETLNKYI